MKVALITGGQPRFTNDLLRLFKQLCGFNTADLYISLWNSDWAKSLDEGYFRIKKILPSNYNLKKLQIVDEPSCILPSHVLNHPPEQPENIRWWYRRRRGQLLSLSMAFDMIDENYDLIVRFRLDGCLDRNVDISKFDLQNYDLIMPQGPTAGFSKNEVCDQFFVATQEGMKFFSNLGKTINEIIPISDPNWEHNGHGTWAPEHLIYTYYKLHNKKIGFAPFQARFNTEGRSRFTDRHYHHKVVLDPTE